MDHPDITVTLDYDDQDMIVAALLDWARAQDEQADDPANYFADTSESHRTNARFARAMAHKINPVLANYFSNYPY
jgi:hypothetical protein